MKEKIEYSQGNKVVVNIEGVYKFEGEIVGLAYDGPLYNTYIVQCTDGFLPNKTYSFVCCLMPDCYITLQRQ